MPTKKPAAKKAPTKKPAAKKTVAKKTVSKAAARPAAKTAKKRGLKRLINFRKGSITKKGVISGLVVAVVLIAGFVGYGLYQNNSSGAASRVQPSCVSANGTAAAVAGIAKCLVIPPASGVSSRDDGAAACVKDSNNWCKKPASPYATWLSKYASARTSAGTTKSTGGYDKNRGIADGTDQYMYYGASCDQFVATVMRYSGADNTFPVSSQGVKEQQAYITAHIGTAKATPAGAYYGKVATYTISSTTYKSLVAGDILVQTNNNHIMIYMGSGIIGEASNNARFPSQRSLADWGGAAFNVYRVAKAAKKM